MEHDWADEWLEELLKPPPPDSDDEWLQELIRPMAPGGTMPVGHTVVGAMPVGRMAVGRSMPWRHLDGHDGHEPSNAREAPLCQSPRSSQKPQGAVSTPASHSGSTGSSRFEQVACNGDESAMQEELRQHVHFLRSRTWLSGTIHDRGMIPYLVEAAFPFTYAWLDLVAHDLRSSIMGVLSARGLSVFKIGITSHAPHRMFNLSYGYAVRGDRFDRMDLLVASFPAACAYLERALIAAFRCTPGCRNDNPGGESVPKEGLCFVYLVSLPEEEITRRRRAKVVCVP